MSLSLGILFTSYTSGDFGSVKMVHEGVVRCIGVGQVCLEMSNGSRLILKHVKHVPWCPIELTFHW